VVFGAFLSFTFGGCLSNQYTIPPDELARLAQLPPEQRGQQVLVVQGLGERRGDAIEANQPPPAPGYQGPPPTGYVEGGPYVEPHAHVGVIITPPLPGPGLGHHHYHHAPPGPKPMARPRTSKGGSKLGKGGGSGKDDLIALIIVAAVLATVGMIATEGSRYDGHVAMYPWQPVHLQDYNGQEREVPLAQLTPADAAATREALVMDDEGWGMVRLGRRPLDRKGFTFKMDVGGFQSSYAGVDSDGVGFGLQFGFFPHHMAGILGSWSIAGGSNADGNTFTRNDLALELQFFPLSFSILHLGGFGHVGTQWARDEGLPSRSGLAMGGGGIFEISLTTRLALALRVGYNTAKVGYGDQRWMDGLLITGGVAIY